MLYTAHLSVCDRVWTWTSLNIEWHIISAHPSGRFDPFPVTFTTETWKIKIYRYVYMLSLSLKYYICKTKHIFVCKFLKVVFPLPLKEWPSWKDEIILLKAWSFLIKDLNNKERECIDFFLNIWTNLEYIH